MGQSPAPLQTEQQSGNSCGTKQVRKTRTKLYKIQKQGNSCSTNPLKTQLILLILHWRWLPQSVTVQNSKWQKNPPSLTCILVKTVAGAVTGLILVSVYKTEGGLPKGAFLGSPIGVYTYLSIWPYLSGTSFKGCLYPGWIHSIVGVVQTQSSTQYLPQRVYTLTFKNLNNSPKIQRKFKSVRLLRKWCRTSLLFNNRDRNISYICP